MDDERIEISAKGAHLKRRIEEIVKFECTNSFGKGENKSVVYSIDDVYMGTFSSRGKGAFLSFRKESDPNTYVRDTRVPMHEARMIGGSSKSLLFLILSEKLGKDVMVRIPHFFFNHTEKEFLEAWTSDFLYYRSVWEPIADGPCPPELRNLVRIFDCSDIYGPSSGKLVGPPDIQLEKTRPLSYGVSVGVSECCKFKSIDSIDSIEPMGSMDRKEARSILMGNGNIYGLFRALYAMQDPNRPSGIGYSHMLIHGNLGPDSLVVVEDEITGAPIVKIDDWSLGVVVPLGKKVDRFIFEFEEIFIIRNGQGMGKGGIHIKQNLSYSAPELMQGRTTDTRKLDVFSLGLLLFEMFTMYGRWYNAPEAKDLWKDKSPAAHRFCAGSEKSRGEWNGFISTSLEMAELPEVIANIIKKCCELDFKKRPTLEDVLIIMEKAGLCPEEMKGVAITEEVRQEANMPKITAVPKGNVKKPVKKPVAKPAVTSKKLTIDEKKLAVNNMADAANAFPGNSTTPELPLK
ncbi:MAG: hypothetical protein LBU15_01270 [Rickettsiales bacterium]|nr:hypothetical protein [Rickettsiales bacterium]